MSLIHIYAQKWHSSEIHMGFIATVCNIKFHCMKLVIFQIQLMDSDIDF